MAGINRAARLKLHEAQPFYFEPFKYSNDMTDNEYIEILIAFFDAKDAAHGHTGKEVQEWLKSLKYKLKPDSGWIPNFYFDEENYKWHLPTEALPDHKERVIIVLKNGSREQFATWNSTNGMFVNSGGTQFKPEQIKCWLPTSVLPPIPALS